MAVTYDDTLATDRDLVRFNIQDTTVGNGPKPSKANFTDAELDGLLTFEGTQQKATAAAFSALEAAWRMFADRQVGQRREQSSQIADGYAERAERMRDEFGYTGGATIKMGWITKVDGYSDNISAGDV